MKNKIQEVAQPLSQGEKNFKDMHKAVNHKTLVPGVTDQEHVFNGATKPYDNKFLHSNKPGEDIASYDGQTKMDNKMSEMGYEKAEVEEATLSAKAARAGKDIGKKGKNFAMIAKSAAKRYVSKEAGEKVAGAVLAKMRASKMHEDVESVDEKLSPEQLKKFAAMAPPKDKITQADKIVAAKMKQMKEDHDDTQEEVSMVRTELKAMIVSAQDLLDNMPSDMHIEPWVQSKIAVAKSMVCGVHDFMLYSDEAGQPADMRIAPSMPMMGNPYSMSNEEVEEVDEALASFNNIKAGAIDRYKKSREGQPQLSPKQKKIAAVAGDPDKIDADDFAALRAGKKIKEETSIDSPAILAAISSFNKLREN